MVEIFLRKCPKALEKYCQKIPGNCPKALEKYCQKIPGNCPKALEKYLAKKSKKLS